MNELEEVIIDGDKYRRMVIGPAPNPATDIFQDGCWYTKDPRKQKQNGQ